SAATLRRLSKANVVYELPEADRGAWDRFSTRNIGLAVQRRMARDFDGDAEAMRKAAVARLGRLLDVSPQKLKAQEQPAFIDFATALSLIPDVSHWSSDEKAALRAVIAAKSAKTEQRYQRLLLKHKSLRGAILQIGSKAR
ncbi:MAG TPA: hypothetical protein VGK21_02545, partial [Candidatus Angelobacter sp.]